MDGISLHSLLNGKNPSIEHETLFWFGGERAAVRSGKWKYRWANDADNSFAKRSTKYEGVALELGAFLHDMQTDIGEKVNLKDTEKVVFEDLQNKLSIWKKEVVGDIAN